MDILLGAHVSVAGGFKNACLNAKATSSNAIQIFTKNQLVAPFYFIDPVDVGLFKNCIAEQKIKVVSHLSYLVNLGSTDDAILKNSINAFVDEIKRCDQLNINLIVFHPGSNKILSEKETIKRIADNLNYIIAVTASFTRIRLVIETTAGQGNQIGYKIEQIAEIIELVEDKNKIGVCIDTCHIFSAGYDIINKKSYDKFIAHFDDVIGLNYLKVIHLNDSLKPIGSKIDRHASIGRGYMGLEAFRLIINDERLRGVLFIVETPGGNSEHKSDIELLRNMLVK
ncbi:MAG: deoxyribonuclease IV [Deltaproteobacteria bacterium]|nr:deoxyribonuclease IV [Deltaproteobacteria bacterium]